MKKVLVLVVVLSLAVAGIVYAGVTDSHHDMTTKGVSGTTQVCVFCHHPHRGNVTGWQGTLLWNFQDTTLSFTTYTSSTMNATTGVGSLDGDMSSDNSYSAACMACHDGETGTDSLAATPGDASAAVVLNPIGASMTGKLTDLGSTLADDHPVDFDYSEAAADPGIKAAVGGVVAGASSSYPLYGGTMQCATCHMVHNADSEASMQIQFMRGPIAASEICTDCHIDK